VDLKSAFNILKAHLKKKKKNTCLVKKIQSAFNCQKALKIVQTRLKLLPKSVYLLKTSISQTQFQTNPKSQPPNIGYIYIGYP
jgi:hypothetical protein